MSKEPELKARDKVVLRMTRDGAVEENLTAGTEQRASKRLEDAELVKPVETAASSEALSPEELKLTLLTAHLHLFLFLRRKCLRRLGCLSGLDQLCIFQRL